MKFIKENYLDAGAIDELVTLLKQIDNQKVAYWMYFMNPADQVEIMNKIDRPYKNALRTILYDMKSKDDNLMNKANVFEVKDLDTTLSEIGSAEFYPVEDLAVIYSNLSLTKSSEVLKNVSDEEFKKNLLESISKREKLTSDSNKIAENLEKTLDYLQEYDKKIQELADIYNRMTTAEVVKIVEKMMINDQRLEYFDMNGIEGIELTDEKIILDILDKLGKTKVSEIINQLDTRKATELTRKLAIQ
jgi:Mg/Co/Ni transporter MgtE